MKLLTFLFIFYYFFSVSACANESISKRDSILPVCNECCFSYEKLCRCIQNKEVYLVIVSPDVRDIYSSFGHTFFIFSQGEPCNSDGLVVSLDNVRQSPFSFKGILFINDYSILRAYYEHRSFNCLKLRIRKNELKKICKNIWMFKKTVAYRYSPISFNCADFAAFILRGTSLQKEIKGHLFLTPISLYEDISGGKEPWYLGNKVDLSLNLLKFTFIFSGNLESQVPFTKRKSEIQGFLEILELVFKRSDLTKLEKLTFLRRLYVINGNLTGYSLSYIPKKGVEFRFEKGKSLEEVGSISLCLQFFSDGIVPDLIFRRNITSNVLLRLDISRYVGVKLYFKNWSLQFNKVNWKGGSNRGFDFELARIFNF